MKAARLLALGRPGLIAIENIPDPKPGIGEVVVQVNACGLNRLDLWLEEGGLPMPSQIPRTPGGEISGVIDEVGTDVSEWKVGDRVAVQSNIFCGHCEYCQKGEESLCLTSELIGVQRDGGFAERVAVPARTLVLLPENVSFTTAAGLTLAGSTAVHMLTNRTQVKSGEWVLVIGGASGVGSAAIQIARLFNARVIATASTPAKQSFCRDIGADHVVDSSLVNWHAKVRDLTGKRGVDLVVEHVGGTVLTQALHCLARGGRVVTCGATGGREVEINLWPFFVKQFQLIGSYGRTRKEIETTLNWAAAGKLKASIDCIYHLDQTKEAFLALRERRINGKALICP